jgi:8-oxo-dGTP pyrophosphatase MutT (NUDIX family)
MQTLPAASAVLLKAQPGAAPQILITERSPHMRFAGGAYVFPGGRVDAADLATARNPVLAQGFAGLDDADAAARVAAIRETFEETGLLLTRGPAAGPAPLANSRNLLAKGPDSAEACTFAALIAGLGHRVDAQVLHPFAQWQPAENAEVTRRYLTHFYLIDVTDQPLAPLSPDGQEAVSLQWITAAALLENHLDALVFPTRCLLARIAQYPDIAALLAAAARHGSVMVQPLITNRGGEPWVTIPEGLDYPQVEAPLASLRCT